MKKTTILAMVLLANLILVACKSQNARFEDTRDHSKTTTTQSTAPSNTQEITSEATTTKEASTEEAASQVKLWSSEKNQALATFIQQWGLGFSPAQHYVGYSPDQVGSFYGVSIPNSLIKPTGLTPDFQGSTPQIVWSTDGQAPAGQYALVATYSDIETSPYPSAHLYLFTIRDGQAQVWISQQNQGNPEMKFYFKETQNAQLRDFFVSLVRNQDPTNPSHPESSSSVDTKNLTMEQCSNWARAHKASEYGNPYSKEDFIAHVTGIDQSADGLVYIEVRENHNSPTMQENGADASVSSSPSFYRINADGQLELRDIVSGSYRVVSSIYFE